MKKPAKKRAAKKAAPTKRQATRRNAPTSVAVSVKQFGGKRGHLVGRDVLAIEYRHSESKQRTPYRHDFQENGVELWALADGSLLIRHPRFRLWEDFTVGDDE